MTNQESCLDGLGREESRSIALVWRGRERVSDDERGLGFFFFLNMGRIWIISIPYPVKLYLEEPGITRNIWVGYPLSNGYGHP